MGFEGVLMKPKVVKLQQIQEALIRTIYNEASTNERKSKRKNLDPRVWGPNAWKFIDNVIEGYPNNPNNFQRLRMHDFLVSLGELLPCQKCRDNFKQFQKKLPVTQHVRNKLTVRRWLRLYKQHQKLLKVKQDD